MTDEMIYIILPIVLFIINLIIVLILRKADSIKHGLTNIRRLTDSYRNEIENKTNAFHTELEDIEGRFSKAETELRTLLSTVGTEISNIKTYNEDLSSLRQSMDSYREALAALAKLTNTADTKVSQIEEDVLRLENVENKIKSFQLEMKDAEEYLNHHESTVIQLQKDAVSQLENSIAGFKVHSDKILKESKDTILLYNNELEHKAEALHKASLEIDASSEKMLSIMGDRARDQQMLAQQISNLTQTREDLIRKIREINSEIEEKKAFSNQLDEMTRSENLHLAKLKENVKQYQNTISLYENQAKRTQDVVIEPKSEGFSARNTGYSADTARQVSAGAGTSIPEPKAEPTERGSAPENESVSPAETQNDVPAFTPEPKVVSSYGIPQNSDVSTKETENAGALDSEVVKEDPYLNAGLRMMHQNSQSSEDYDGTQIIIKDSPKQKLEYYGKEEEIVF